MVAYTISIASFLVFSDPILSTVLLIYGFIRRCTKSIENFNGVEYLSVLLLSSIYKSTAFDNTQIFVVAFVELSAILILYLKISRVKYYPQKSVYLFIYVFCLLIHLSLTFPSLITLIGVVREYILPVLFIMTFSEKHQNSMNFFSLASVFFISMVLVGFYTSDLFRLPIELNDGSVRFESRTLFGYEISRLNSPLSISTGGSSIVFALLAYYNWINRKLGKHSWLTYFISVGFLSLGLLTASLGFFMALLTIFMIITGRKFSSLLIFVSLLLFISLAMNFMITKEYGNSFDLIAVYVDKTIGKLDTYSLTDYLLGGYYEVQSKVLSEVRIIRDIGFFRGFLSVGLIVLIPFYWILKKYRDVGILYRPFLVVPILYLHGFFFSNIVLVLMYALIKRNENN